MTVDMTTMTTTAARNNDHDVLFQRELKEDWDDFESPTTKSIEMLEDSGHLVNVDEDPVLITPSPSGDAVKTTTKQHRQESTKSMTPIREDTAEEVDHPSASTTIERPATTASSEDGPTNRSSDKPQFVSPKDFELLKVIGMGAFGKVVQVRNKKSQKVLAMKVISKRLLRRKSSYIKQMQLERDVLKKVRHPFIVTMHCSFQAKEKLFIVMDFLAGGELFERLGKEGIFLESQACFYLAEIILALEHLHSHNILHRDLKPENILLGSDGHVCLTDFGLAKDFSIEQGYWSEIPEEEKKETDDGDGKETSSDSNNTTAETKTSTNDTEEDEPVHRARTICGTTEYMAPEMIARKGYGKAADFWSLGCVAYEMLSGNTPFTSRKGEKDLMRKILCERIKMPPMITSDAVKLLKGLLNRNPQDRLGNSKGNMFHVGGVTGLKQMPFFETIQWTKLEQKEMDPPAKFAVQHESDTQYFHEEFLKMNLPRSITEMSNDRYQPRRCASDQFKGFSFIQQDFDLPERNDSELDLYWNGTADPDCDSISECASGIFGDNDDLSVGNNTSNSVVDKTPPSASTSAKKKKKNKAAAATTATTAETTTSVGGSDPAPTTGDIVKPTPQSQQPVTSDHEQEQKTSVEARPSNVDIKPATVMKPNIPTVPSTHSLSSASGTSSILSTTKLSRVASIQQQQELDQDPLTPGGQDGGRRQLLVSAALTPSRGSYVPPHLRATSSGSFSSLGTSATKSPGSSSQYKKGPTYLASPNIYARSNVALHGTKSSAAVVNHVKGTTTKINTTQHSQQLVLPSGLPTLPIVAGGATTNKNSSTNAWATVTSSKKGGGGNDSNSGKGAAASIPSLKPRTVTTSASSTTTAKVGGVGGAASSSSAAWQSVSRGGTNPSTNRKTPGTSTGGLSQSKSQPQPQQRQIPSVSSASAVAKPSKPSTGTWGKPSATLAPAPAPAPAPPPPNVMNNPNDFPSWPTLGGGQDKNKGGSIPSKATTSSSTPAKKPPAGVWGISSSSSNTSAKKKSTTTPSPWKQAR